MTPMTNHMAEKNQDMTFIMKELLFLDYPENGGGDENGDENGDKGGKCSYECDGWPTANCRVSPSFFFPLTNFPSDGMER